MSEEKVTKKLPKKERMKDLRRLIRELGFWNLPSYRELGKRYGVTHVSIIDDMDKIVVTLDKKELDRGFTEFYEADKKAQNEIRKILINGTIDQKLKAISAMIQLQNAFTDLLEKYGKKQKLPDKIEVTRTSLQINQDIKEYTAIFNKLTEDEREKIKLALVKDIEGDGQ